MSKCALITGISGQDGQLLATHLLKSGYRVLGVSHEEKLSPFLNKGNFKWACSDYSKESLINLIFTFRIEEIYHLAGKSNVQESKVQPDLYLSVNTNLVKNLLDACVEESNRRKIKLFNASSSEIFSGNLESPQSETTKQIALNPYGASKIEANKLINDYRLKGLFIANAILYNHESSLRPQNFFTSKVIRGLMEFSGDRIPIGNLNSSRDWGLATEYVESYQRMMQLPSGDDFVIATGEKNTVRDFIEVALKILGLKKNLNDYFLIDESLIRADDTSHLVGNPAKAKKMINWNPESDLEKIVLRLVREYRVG